MEFRQWVELAAAGMIGSALGGPLGHALERLLEMLIAFFGEVLSLGWSYVRAIMNATPAPLNATSGVPTEPNVNDDDINGNGNDVESGAIEMTCQ